MYIGIGLDDRHVEELRRLPAPYLDADLVDGVHELLDVGRGEPPAEVARRGGVVNARGADGVEVVLLVAESRCIPMYIGTRPAAEDVVCEVEDVIGLVVRQVELEQMDVVVQRLDQPDLPGQQMHRPDAAAAYPPRPVGHLVMNVAGREHRPPRIGRRPCAEPTLNSFLALSQSLSCNGVHSKLLWLVDAIPFVRNRLTAKTEGFRVLFALRTKKTSGGTLG